MEAFKRDWRQARLSAADAALMELAEKSTRTPWEMRPADLDRLRALGLADVAISDAVQVIAYFNYVNRVADVLGVDPEPGMLPDPRLVK